MLSSYQDVVWGLDSATPIGRALNAARCYIESVGDISDGTREVRALLAHVLQKELDWLFANHSYPLNIEQVKSYTYLIQQRIRNEPLEELIRHSASNGFYDVQRHTTMDDTSASFCPS